MRFLFFIIICINLNFSFCCEKSNIYCEKSIIYDVDTFFIKNCNFNKSKIDSINMIIDLSLDSNGKILNSKIVKIKNVAIPSILMRQLVLFLEGRKYSCLIDKYPDYKKLNMHFYLLYNANNRNKIIK